MKSDSKCTFLFNLFFLASLFALMQKVTKKIKACHELKTHACLQRNAGGDLLPSGRSYLGISPLQPSLRASNTWRPIRPIVKF